MIDYALKRSNFIALVSKPIKQAKAKEKVTTGLF
jgi:hypothetical protein